MSNPLRRKHTPAPRATPVRSSAPISPHQEVIYAAVTSSKDNIAVNAVAGSGKTSTLVGCAERLPGNNLAVAFNKTIQEELQSRTKSSAKAMTLHGLGMRLLYQMYDSVNFDPKQESPHIPILRNRIGDELSLPEKWNPWRGSYAVYDLFSKLRNGVVVDPEETQFTSAGKPIPQNLVDFAFTYLDSWVEELHNSRSDISIDYDDMVFVPATIMNPKESLYTDWNFLVDESQDVSPPQLALLKRLAPQRIIFFGDPNQSCYAFRGAMPSAFAECASSFSCIELPLSVSWRCPRSVVTAARHYVPRIDHAENAPEGYFGDKTLEDLRRDASPTDMVVCRNNAPIIKLCVADLLEGKPSRVLGQDIKGTLTKIGKDVLCESLDETLAEIMVRKNKIASDSPKSVMIDLLEAVAEIYGSLADNIEEHTHPTSKALYGYYCSRINYLFREGDKQCLTYSTIHRAKGSEADTVWFYLPDLIPSRYAKTEDELQQEDNLAYVAITRAKKNLYRVYG